MLPRRSGHRSNLPEPRGDAQNLELLHRVLAGLRALPEHAPAPVPVRVSWQASWTAQGPPMHRLEVGRRRLCTTRPADAALAWLATLLP